MQPVVTIDRQQMMDFERTIARTIVQGKKSVSGAMIQASVFASQSAAGSVYGKPNSGKRFRSFGKKTRNGKRLKRLKLRRDKKTGKLIAQKSGKRPWWSIGYVDIWSKGKETRQYFRTIQTFNKAKQVPRRGLAGHVWRAAGAVKASGIESIARQAFNRGSTMRMIGAYSDNKTTKTDGMISNIKLSNSLEYISKVAPNSAREGIAEANKKLSGILRKDLARDIEKAFQKRMRG